MHKLASFILAGLLALCVAITLVCASGANAADGFSKDTMKRMGTFVSNFTELGMTNLPDAQNLPDEQYVAFGVRHEWVNNRKRFKMGDGVASIEASHIENAVMRYFGKAFRAHRAVPDYGIQYDPATKRYTIPVADGETRTYARVGSVTQNADGRLVMRGTLYNAKDTKETFGPFTAKAKPHKWNGKETWALLSLELTSEAASGANSKPAMKDAMPVQATATNGCQDTLVDTPGNLDVVWARAANKGVILRAGPSDSSSALATLDNGDIINLVGERDVNGETWYAGYIVKKTSPVDGWVRAKDMWFSPVHDIGFYPKSHLLYSRLRTRLNRYLGNWPDMTRKIMGRERDAKFGKGNGSVIHTLSWPGLRIVYENSYRRPENAWISYVNVVPGRVGDKVRFGPIHLGSSIDEVRALGKHLGFEYKYQDRNTKLTERLDEVDTPEGLMIQLSTEFYGRNGQVGSPYSFSFFIRDDKVVRMEHRWAYHE